MSTSEFESLRNDLEGLEDEYLRNLIERASLIDELTHHPGWALFVEYLMALSASMEERMLKSYAKSFDEYRFETGKLAGLQTAIQAPTRLQVAVRIAQEQAEQARLLASEIYDVS